MIRRKNEADDEFLNECTQKARSLESKASSEAKEYYEEAVKRCDELLRSNPENPYLHCRKADILYELRRFEGPDSLYVKRCKDALAEIDTAIELDPEVDFFHLIRSEIVGEFMYLPDWSIEASMFRELDMWACFHAIGPPSIHASGFAVDADGGTFEIYSYSYSKLNDIEWAFKDYLERYPRDPDCYNNLGVAHYMLGAWDMYAYKVRKALEELNEAIILNPNNPAYYNNRALASLSLIIFKERTNELKNVEIDAEKMLETILSDLEKAVKLDPYNPYYRYNKGFVLYEMERYGEAMKELDEAIAIDPSNHYFYHKKGMVFYKLGRYDEALEEFKKSLELDKDKRVANYMIMLVKRVKSKKATRPGIGGEANMEARP